MKVGTGMQGGLVADVPQKARKSEELGYDFFATNETKHNPFISAALAAEHTERAQVRTSIALSFARSPMDTAYMAWDLQSLSGGRFQLGMGSQVRGHIVRRFNMPWGMPAARMREYIMALRHIWNSWQTGEKLDFKGDFYNFNLMPPFFTPDPIEHPDIKIYIAAVNERMLQTAGEVCDGVLLHSFGTFKYIKEVAIPNLQKGAERAGRSIADIDVNGGGYVITGPSEERIERSRQEVKNAISFYASTRSYAPVMNHHGWNDTAQSLYRMSVEGKWGEMGALITDEMLDEFAIVGSYDDVVDKIKATYGPFASSLSFSIPVNSGEDEEVLKDMIARLQSD